MLLLTNTIISFLLNWTILSNFITLHAIKMKESIIGSNITFYALLLYFSKHVSSFFSLSHILSLLLEKSQRANRVRRPLFPSVCEWVCSCQSHPRSKTDLCRREREQNRRCHRTDCERIFEQKRRLPLGRRERRRRRRRAAAHASHAVGCVDRPADGRGGDGVSEWMWLSE